MHPAWVLATRFDSLRLPCFWFGARYGVLPAFGAFTGMHPIEPDSDCRVFAIAGDALIEVPRRRDARRLAA